MSEERKYCIQPIFWDVDEDAFGQPMPRTLIVTVPAGVEDHDEYLCGYVDRIAEERSVGHDGFEASRLRVTGAGMGDDLHVSGYSSAW
ncbi:MULTISPECIES: hypothetical protein [unclassified Thioalkalivibrio]|uniref:hypothetical protein n=1 Tax=unclassified Thioalkalivibrio TaxID=2621013 RepID=UPI0004755B9B|nr:MULTISPECIES: hypothetical protein [unclassified Thioalkalivibrio]